jgi:hypothetical protein
MPLHRKSLVVGLCFAALALAGLSAARAQTASSSEVGPGNQYIIRGGNILLIETTSTILDSILSGLGQNFDVIGSEVWTGIDFGPYDIVFIGMDGGAVDPPSVAAVRQNAIDAGKRVCWFGGTCYQPFVDGVDASLLDVDTVDICWEISSAPHFTLVDAGHPMGAGLPGSMTFATAEAAFYQLRPTDANLQVVGVNGDGFDSLFFKGSDFPGGGTGQLVWLTNSPFESYWTDGGDLGFLTQVVDNCLQPEVPVELDSVSVE